MDWDAEDKLYFLEEFGREVVINSISTYAIVKTKGVEADGIGGLLVTDPTARVATTDVALLAIKGGEDGSQLLDGEIWYRVLSVFDLGNGFSIIRLEVQE